MFLRLKKAWLDGADESVKTTIFGVWSLEVRCKNIDKTIGVRRRG